MNNKENENSKSKGFLSKEAIKELKLNEAEIRKDIAATKKVLDGTLPPYKGKY